MKNIDDAVQENDNNVILKGSQADVIDLQNEQPFSNESDPMLNKTENVGNDNTHLPLRSRRFVDAPIDEQNVRSTSAIEEMNENLDPIAGYAKEPLLPLTEACAPLVNIVHDLSAYIRLALNETPLKPSDGLTFDESAAIRLYSMEWDDSHESLYLMINIALKNADRQTLLPYFKYLKLLLTGLIKLPCVPVQTVWRGVSKDLTKTFPPQTRVTWWTLSSCITSLVLLENNMYLSNKDERTLFSIDIINGRNIRAHSHFDTEDEILILPGTCMEVVSQFSSVPGINIIHLRQIIPMDRLLELPFKGALLYPSTKKKVPCYKNKWIICALILLIIILCLVGIIFGKLCC